MLKTVLFDMDGTLLPMDLDVFVKSYMKMLAVKMAPMGYDPERLIACIWQGTDAMVKNDGKVNNDTVFWKVFTDTFGEEALKDMPYFEDFYRNEFQKAKEVCGFNPLAAQAVRELHEMGLNTVLATNPLFPAVATESRVRWVGLQPEDFLLITTYENSSFCKPNTAYYQEILTKLNLNAEECLMVGNDVAEDMVARELGMQVFLLTDCLINRNNEDINAYPHGSFPELMAWVKANQ